MLWSRQTTAEPGEIREIRRESPETRRRGKLPIRDSPRPTAWPTVPAFNDINQILRSDVVPESPLFCTPNDTPGDSAMSPESMAVEEHMRIVQQLEARRDAEDGLYEPSQAGTPGQWLNHLAQEELDREAEMLSRGTVLNESRRRKLATRAEFPVAEAGVPSFNETSAPGAESTDSGDGFAMDLEQQSPRSPLSASADGLPTSTTKRRSPEPQEETPLKRRKRIERVEGLLQTRPYASCKEKGKAERDSLLDTIQHLWQIPCHAAIPKNLWVHTSKGTRAEPRDWATHRILVPMRRLAVATPRYPALAVTALRQAIHERTRRVPHSPPRIYVESDLDRAFEIAEARPVSPSQTLGRSQAAEVVEQETLSDVLRRTVEPRRSSIYQATPEPAVNEAPRNSVLQSSPEPPEDSDGSVTIAKVDSPPVSPTLSHVPIKIESSPPVTAPANRLLQEPRSRYEVMQMAPRDLWDFLREAEKRLKAADDEMLRRIEPTSARPGELSALKRDQLKKYRSIAKADAELAEQVWDRLAEKQSQENAIVID
ncbi:hypothetical protein CLAFUR0_13230 [Fulvia fulva]|nr:hypothetical protein CLAFUR0_13230 [Fulvia fulva]